MNILVTGGAGYIGAITTKLLIDLGYKVVVVDSLENSDRSAINSRAEFYQGQIQDKALLKTILNKYRFSAIMHFAACASVEESYKNPMKYYENNSVASYILISECMNANIKNFIFSSSCSIYGNSSSKKINENMIPHPINPYAETKLETENLLRYVSKSDTLNVACLRFFNVAGASLDGNLGENHKKETHLIPNVIKNAINEEPILIFGNNYNTKDGTCIRDYVHVLDIAEAHVVALRAMLSRKIKKFNVFNVGTGKGYSNLEVIKTCEKLLSKKISIIFKGKRLGDPEILIADPFKLNRVLGFKTKHSQIDQIIKTHILWYNNQNISPQKAFSKDIYQ